MSDDSWVARNIVWIVVGVVFAYAIWDYYNNMQVDPFFDPGNY